MSAKQHAGNLLLGLLPPTRAFGTKRFILRWMGVDASLTCRVAYGVRVLGRLAVSIGDDTFVGHSVLISGGVSSVSLGDRVDIAPRVTFATGSHQVDIAGPRAAGAGFSRDIVVQDGVWIGAGSTVLGGVVIGENAVIAAGSVVTRNIPPRCLAAGVPCRVKKVWCDHRRSWVEADQREAA